jgi:hypothetical protein
MDISTTSHANLSADGNKFDGRLSTNLELGEEIKLEEIEGHPTIYANPELSKAILNFLAML